MTWWNIWIREGRREEEGVGGRRREEPGRR
jgi:hypothetical protein